METSSVVKVVGGTVGTGAIVGASSYGVYEVANKGSEEQHIPGTLREKFGREGKIVLKKQGEEKYEESIGGFTNDYAWKLLVSKYGDSGNKDQLFKDLPDLTKEGKTEQEVLQEKCTSVLNAPGLENETAAIIWCTRSSDFLKLLSERPAASSPPGQL